MTLPSKSSLCSSRSTCPRFIVNVSVTFAGPPGTFVPAVTATLGSNETVVPSSAATRARVGFNVLLPMGRGVIAM